MSNLWTIERTLGYKLRLLYTSLYDTQQIYVAPFLEHAVEKAVGVEVKLLNPPGGLGCVAVGAGDASDPNTRGVTNAKVARSRRLWFRCTKPSGFLWLRCANRACWSIGEPAEPSGYRTWCGRCTSNFSAANELKAFTDGTGLLLRSKALLVLNSPNPVANLTRSPPQPKTPCDSVCCEVTVGVPNEPKILLKAFESAVGVLPKQSPETRSGICIRHRCLLCYCRGNIIGRNCGETSLAKHVASGCRTKSDARTTGKVAEEDRLPAVIAVEEVGRSWKLNSHCCWLDLSAQTHQNCLDQTPVDQRKVDRMKILLSGDSGQIPF